MVAGELIDHHNKNIGIMVDQDIADGKPKAKARKGHNLLFNFTLAGGVFSFTSFSLEIFFEGSSQAVARRLHSFLFLVGYRITPAVG